MPNDPNTGWYVGIIAALALLAVGYLVFAANSVPLTPLSYEESQP